MESGQREDRMEIPGRAGEGIIVPHAEGNHQAQENQQQAEEAPTAPTVNRLDRFLTLVINSAFPELITGVVSIGRAGIGITDGFITGSIPLAVSTVGIGCLGIADDILYFVSNRSEFRVDDEGNWVHQGPRWPLNIAISARALTTLADFVTLFLGIWSLWVMLMPTRIDENTPLLQGISYGETASGSTSTIAGIISAAHSFFFLRRARIAAEDDRDTEREARVAAEDDRDTEREARVAAEDDRDTEREARVAAEDDRDTEREARVAAEAALLRIVINTGWRVWTDGVGELQTKLRLTSNFLQREAIEDIDIFLADFNTISEQATGAYFEEEAYTMLDTTFHQLPAEIQSEFIYEAETSMLSDTD